MDALDRLERFVRMMKEKPIRLDDEFYSIHVGTEWEAELRFSDIEEVVRLARLANSGEK